MRNKHIVSIEVTTQNSTESSLPPPHLHESPNEEPLSPGTTGILCGPETAWISKNMLLSCYLQYFGSTPHPGCQSPPEL